MKKLKALLAIAVILGGCATQPQFEENINTVENLYNEGMDFLSEGLYSKAIHTFEELERQHPYSAWAVRAQIMKIFTHYQMGAYEELFVSADHFIKNHPGHKDIPYILYLKAEALYVQIKDIKRDQQPTLDALTAFEELINRYPQSDYAKDARLKITLCHGHLAAKEILVGKYYQDKQQYLPALNRFRYVVEQYDRSIHVQEALYRLTEVYLALGLENEAQSAAAVLGHNYPTSRWYKNAYTLLVESDVKPVDYVEESSWLNTVLTGVKSAFGMNTAKAQ